MAAHFNKAGESARLEISREASTAPCEFEESRDVSTEPLDKRAETDSGETDGVGAVIRMVRLCVDDSAIDSRYQLLGI